MEFTMSSMLSKQRAESSRKKAGPRKSCQDSSRKAHNEQLVKFAQVNSLTERQVQQLNAKPEEISQDKDIAELRKALGTNEFGIKEMGYRITHHEQENQELVGFLKEFREAQIQNAGGNSLKKLQNRLRGLEQLRSQHSMNLNEKEAQWSSQFEKMTGNRNS
ncbi:hypothetical protein RHSIM_Rhsim11G0139800 [Rhododendron simsii]|uniref:Uncharacterized protein n=1 Tax=Rhododendron simsii TaxID=118357 RepID=A0A834G8U4_RHOSS|nr:hypothetical protein RHSIM_Rhsim11G0139800 [Rhododendron simsii]